MMILVGHTRRLSEPDPDNEMSIKRFVRWFAISGVIGVLVAVAFGYRELCR